MALKCEVYGIYMVKGFGSKKQTREDYLNFLLEVLQATIDSEAKDELVVQLLQANIDKLDDKFAQFLRNWATANLIIEMPDNAEDIGILIGNFSDIIREFLIGNRAINLEIALTGYEIAIQVISREESGEEWARFQNNLGIAYFKRIRGDISTNLELAIVCYQKALQVYTSDNFMEDWAMVQQNLGNAYRERIHYEKAENLEQAIACYENALEIYSPKNLPQFWAITQSNLGNAYWKRIFGDHAENIERAIVCQKNALEVYTREAYPQGWALTQHDLGIVYSQRILGLEAENLKRAIICFDNALQVQTRKDLPQEWAMTQLSLGNAYSDLTLGEPAENLEQAIVHYQNALQIYTRQNFPQDWALTQNNLGVAYRDRILGKKVKNLEKAIACYHNALQVYTHEAFPENWAMTQNNLGVAYEESVCANQAENLKRAIICYKNTLLIRTPTTYPIDCLTTGRNMGRAAFNARLWITAIEGYAIAIEAVETSRTWAKSESRRQKILEEAIEVYQNMVQACINAGQIEKAFEYSERSRSKLLVDLMASYNLSQGEEIPPKVQELLQQYEELQQQIEQERQRHKSENNRSETRAAFQAYNEAIATLEAEKQQVWENIRREDPVLAGEIQVNPLKLSEIQEKLIDETNTAILSFYTTNSDTHIFVVQKKQITLHTCTGQGLDTLQGWINQNWLLPYISDRKKWETQINTILRELAERLQISELISQHLQGIEELILVPHLLLHQIPFTALPTGEYQEYLGDKFLIRYSPSCQILDFCEQRDTVDKMTLQYGTVEDAEDNLPCAKFEGEKLAQIYNIPRENRLIGSNQATTKNYRQLAQQVQVLHSCHHAESRLDNPLESNLKLVNGTITLGQLMTPNWRLPQLVEVFLSCCETNLGTPSLTDDILTLSTGFLCAGARSVVSTLWSVNDLATALFSIFYYQQRQESKNRPQALQQAQTKLRELKKEEFLRSEDIKKLYNHAKTEFEEAQNKRSQYERSSAEWLKWTKKFINYRKLKNQIEVVENSIEQFPFSDPRYWAAFICHGLR